MLNFLRGLAMSDGHYSNKDAGILFHIEVLENGEWHTHTTTGTLKRAIKRVELIRRNKYSDDVKITEEKIQ
jgi:hypothetical protein